jgi:hypothetical protein
MEPRFVFGSSSYSHLAHVDLGPPICSRRYRRDGPARSHFGACCLPSDGQTISSATEEGPDQHNLQCAASVSLPKINILIWR